MASNERSASLIQRKKKIIKAGAVKKILKSNRTYKDGVFTKLFHDKSKILELYNALTGAGYGMDTDIKIQTLADVLYHVRKNDLAFSVDNRFVVLAEHQSSDCKNMPVRFLLYVARVYEKLLHSIKLYSSTKIEIQTPSFYVLYNGTGDMPEESIQRLSDSFVVKGEYIPLELEVKIININTDKHHEVLNKSTHLQQYSLFVDKVRSYTTNEQSRDKAIKQAINDCIKEDILKQFLTENGSEVYNMLFEEYNVNTAIKVAKDETRENIAINMILDNEPIDKIIRFTGLSFQQVEKLQKRFESQLVNVNP